MVSFQTKVLKVLRSPQFFAAILILFFIESVWIAFSAAYPMVFDENVHFNATQLYAHQWGPFLPAHTTVVEPFGALARDPSFLYRYLMSFPYRLIAHVTSNQMIQIIDLRFINVILFGGGLILFRKLLLKTRVSAAIVHTSLLFFVLVPVVPLLAGQINYDNLLMPVTAGALLLTIAITEKLARKELPLANIFWLLTLCLLGSLVQDEFLPIFGSILLWITWQLIKIARSGQINFLAKLGDGWHNSSWKYKSLVALPLVLALYLFFQMYGVNLLRYHTPTPSCGQVLSDHICAGDANWVRTQAALAHPAEPNTSPVLFMGGWVYRMLIALFFTSSGGASPQADYLSINPLPLIFISALVMVVAGILLFARYRQALFKGYSHLGFLLFITFIYTVVLWLHNYHDFVRFGQKFAIQGRYILPVAIPLILLLALAFKRLFGQRNQLKAALLVGLLVLFLQGGGALTYIVDSNQNWYWQNKAVVRINELAQQFVKPFILIKTPLHSFGKMLR